MKSTHDERAKRLKNVPNILSSIRILMVPVFVAVYMSGLPDSRYWAAAVFVLAGATDVLDGHIARKYSLITDLGRMLDPLGDKLMTLAVVSCLAYSGVIPPWTIFFFAVKEVLMLTGGAFIHKKLKAEMPSSNFLGKAASGVIFAVSSALLLFDIPRGTAEEMITVAICVAFMAFGSYILTFKSVLKDSRDERERHKH